MNFGFYLPTRGPTSAPEALETLVTRAEAHGFHSVVIADHIVFPVEIQSPYPYTVSGVFPGQGDALEQLTLMAFIAAKTRHLRLVSSVMIVPYRNPLLTAKALATIDVLSGGRLTVGIGVGWLREEFEALASPAFEHRGAVTDEYVRIFQSLWTEDQVSYEGEFYRFAALRCDPKPVQRPHPPIWIGGHSRPALRRVAKLGQGWQPVGANAAVPLGVLEMKAKLDELRDLTEAAGRSYEQLTISYKAPLYDANKPVGTGEARRPFTGHPDAILGDIATFAELGVGELVFDFRTDSLSESLDRMDQFATTIITRN